LHRFCLIHPCDGQTDGQTDRRTELRWLRRAIAVPAVARKNEIKYDKTTESDRRRLGYHGAERGATDSQGTCILLQRFAYTTIQQS